MLTTETLKNRIDAALGRIPCDTVIRNAKIFDVFSSNWLEKDLGIYCDAIVAVDNGLSGKEVIDLKHHFIVPGFIDAHVHVESSLLTPFNFQKAVLPRGTTTAICDPHEIANVQGIKGIQYFLGASEKLQMDLKIMLSSCVPATSMETNGAGNLSIQDLKPLITHPQVLGLAEMMNVPGLLHKSEEVLEKVSVFSTKPIDGHCPLLKGQELSAYAACGISSCHESSEWEEAKEKLEKGLAVWIREGSVAKDLEALIPLLNFASSPFVGFCTDDRNPLDIAKEGHIDFLIRKSIEKGVPPEVVYRSASWSVANHYGLNRGAERVGALAPGYRADLVVLKDFITCEISEVFSKGKKISQLSLPSDKSTAFENTIQASVPEAKDLEGPQGLVHCIEVIPGKIITGRRVCDSSRLEVAKLSVLERYGLGSKPANAYVIGFGEQLSGAIASSVGHDSHNLCVVGKSTKDMRAALKCLIESGGGFCVVKDQTVLAHLALPLAGLMTPEDPEKIEKKLVDLRKASRAIGCSLPEPFLQLAFLCLPVIPSLKLTDKGLVDVEKFQIIDVAV